MVDGKASQVKRDNKKFAAKLLFQFRVDAGGEATPKRECEIRFINYWSNSPTSALEFANDSGRSAEYEYANSDGDIVHFEFVGVMDFLELGLECHEDEYDVVWYDIVPLEAPMERKNELIPEDSILLGKK